MLKYVYVHRSSISKSTSIMHEILNSDFAKRSVFTQELSHIPCATDRVHLNS